MGQDSKIEWCHHTFNPWWGCTRVSAGCEHCYAESFDRRLGGRHWGLSAGRRLFGDKHWAEPLKWNAMAERDGERRRVFCASMADVFEDRRDLDSEREKLWVMIAMTPWLDWLLLTKRPENLPTLLPWFFDDDAPGLEEGKPPPNVWLGTTVENQRGADERIALLGDAPAVVHFLSCEPLLGRVRLPPVLPIDWVIVGGESGAGARSMDLSWARDLVEQCDVRGIACFVKQLGAKPIDGPLTVVTGDLKGGIYHQWPHELMVREFPRVEV